MRRSFPAQKFICGLLMALSGSVAAQNIYPSKPIRFIVPYATGGATTAVAHLLGQKLSERLGQPVIVDNRPGANTVIGTEALAKSAADGYTIMLAVSTHVLVPQLLATSYDPIRDFSPVTTLTSSEFVLAVHPAVPANSLPELIALAKSRPGELNYSSSGNGGVSHLAGELFNLMAGVKIQHVPYKGGGPALADLIGGQVQMSFQAPVVAIPHINGGKLKAIAISGEKRAPSLPLVPTFTEAGLPDFDARYWFGVLAPAGTPSQLIDVLSAGIAGVWGTPDIKEKLASQALDPFISTPQQFSALLKADMAKYARIIKSGNIKIAN